MRAWPSAMGQQVGVGAASFLQGVGQDRKAVEGTLVVDILSQFLNRGVPPE